MIAGAINSDTYSKDWPKLSNGLSRRLNEIRTSLLDGFIEFKHKKMQVQKCCLGLWDDGEYTQIPIITRYSY